MSVISETMLLSSLSIPIRLRFNNLMVFDLKCKDMLFEVPFESQPISELDPGMEVTN